MFDPRSVFHPNHRICFQQQEATKGDLIKQWFHRKVLMTIVMVAITVVCVNSFGCDYKFTVQIHAYGAEVVAIQTVFVELIFICVREVLQCVHYHAHLCDDHAMDATVIALTRAMQLCCDCCHILHSVFLVPLESINYGIALYHNEIPIYPIFYNILKGSIG